ncbi:hypothetical protein H3221_025425 [Pseudomonas sp. LMG 31766]|uniref:Uncharacterized protein n=1 Tax=Pseudomonas chaetocerotis TaxID=2758695 RepID=A0A931GE69_9PSED|nr:hypothetical protein [Pseudomonas chaetocerotis]MBZ9668081.1 hypothetical protein [Pseudomonas chaetocerotis]
MATLADQRRAIGERNEKARRDLGEANAKARRALGDEMIKRRTGKTEVEEVNALVKQPRQRKALPTLTPRGGVPAQDGTGNYTAPPAGSGGGLASPFTETPGTRTYHETPIVIQSTDGSIFMAVKMPAIVTMTDANGAPAVFNYAEVVDG